MRTKTALLAVTMIAGFGLAGCSSTPAAAPAASSVCDSAALSSVITTEIAPDLLISLDGFECNGDWAYAFPTVGPADGNEEGQYTMTMVFKADGAAWALQDRALVCGTAEIADGAAPYPKDAQVPEPIWLNACQTN